MKIVWVSHCGGLLGAERAIIEGITALTPMGVNIQVIAASDGLLANKLAEIGVSFELFRCSWWVSPHGRRSLLHRAWHLLRNVKAKWRLTKLLKQRKPDLVITNTLTIPFAAFAAKSAGIPHIWYIHEFGYEDHGLLFDFGFSRSLKWMDQLSDRILVNSMAVREKFSPYFPTEKIRLINYAVDVPVDRPRSSKNANGLRLVLVGGISPAKRQEDAIRAISLLARDGISARVTFVGDSNCEYSRSVRALSESLRVSDLIDFVPFTEDPYSYFADSDVALLCSRSEAFGRVTVEAMKFGKPVIGSNVGGTRELIRDGWNGLLYEYGNPDDLASKISLICSDRELLTRMANNARAWSQSTFRIENYGSQLMNVFREVVHGAK